MAGNPLVSVIVPTYNQASLLKLALESVIAQTTGDWEAVVIDNHSQDDTQAVVEGFGDSRFRLEKIHNEGVISRSRNRGIEKARGEWVAFLDSDDLWAPEKLATCLQSASDEIGLICHREDTIRDGAVLRTSPMREDDWPTYRNLLLRENCFSPTAVMVRTKFLREIGGFSEDPELITAEDYDLWLRLARAGIRVKFVDAVLSSYRLHEANSSGSVLRHMKASIAALDRHFEDLEPKRPFDRLRIRRRRAMVVYAAGRSFLQAGQRTQAMRYLVRSFGLFPFRIKTIAAMVLTLAPGAGGRRT